jgi:hypothetical protein
MTTSDEWLERYAHHVPYEPLPRYASVSGGVQPGNDNPPPAAPFPEEPLDQPAGPEPQPGDPGPQEVPEGPDGDRPGPPPLPTAAQLVAQLFEAHCRADRHALAVASMLCGVTASINLTLAAMRDLRSDDVQAMSAITGPMLMSMRQLIERVERSTLIH